MLLVGVAAALAGPWSQRTLLAQSPADLGAREKTEIFIQHLVKVSKIDSAKYQALVLEYEVGTALAELTKEVKEGEEPAPSANPAGFVLDGFVERALKEIHPAYANLCSLAEAGKLDEARDAARALAGSVDPYVAAHANLALAEVEFKAALAGSDSSQYEKVVNSCERIAQKDRLYLVRDHRACELIALCFEKLKKPLLEFLQYAILLTDYMDVPTELENKVKARLAALREEVGQPLGLVANWMNEVEKLLAREVTTKDPTQKQETEIVSALDKLIELQEAQERKT